MILAHNPPWVIETQAGEVTTGCPLSAAPILDAWQCSGEECLSSVPRPPWRARVLCLGFDGFALLLLGRCQVFEMQDQLLGLLLGQQQGFLVRLAAELLDELEEFF